MKLLIVGATGGIGRELVALAVAAGHEVTAAVRDPSRLATGIGGVRLDLAAHDPEAVAKAVADHDAVLSGLGPRSRADIGIARQGTRAIIAAMRETGVRRIVVVSAAPASTVAVARRPDLPRHDPGDGLVMRHVLSPMIKRLFNEHYVDLAEMEEDLRDSGLEWTVVRPPRLSNGQPTGRYRWAYGRNLRGGVVVSRADVAHLMLRVLNEPASIGQCVGVAR